MGIKISETQERVLRAFAHPRRAAEVARELKLARQTLYEHLGKLEKAGLIRRTQRGVYQSTVKLSEPTKSQSKTRAVPSKKPQLPRLVRWRIKRCEQLLQRKRTLPREDPVRELIHPGALRVRRDCYQVPTKEFPVLLWNLLAGFTNEGMRLAGKQFRLPKAPDKDEVVFTYCVDFSGGVWKPQDLAGLSKWENPQTRRLLRAYISHLKGQHTQPSSPS